MRRIRNWSIRTRLLVAFLGVLIPYLVLGGIGVIGLRAVSLRMQSIQHEVVAEIQAIADLQLVVVQLVMPANDYLITGDTREREEFERRLARVQEVLARAGAVLRSPEERRSLALAKEQVARLEALSREILAVADPRGDRSAAAKMNALDRLGDDTAAVLGRVHEVAHREIDQHIQGVSDMIRWVTAAGLIALILSMAGGVGLAFLFSVWLSRPILAIAEGSRRMAEGDLSQRVDARAGAELRGAAQAFNAMAERLEASYAALERRTRELAALVEANQAIASSLDLEHILAAIVNTAAELTGASLANLLLVEGEQLVWKGCAGPLKDAFQQETGLAPIPVGESFAGAVAAQGQALWVPDMAVDPRQVWGEFNARHNLRCYLGVPILAGDRVLGVLNIIGPPNTSVSEAGLDLLEPLAGQAVVAIENARLHSAAIRRGEELGAVLRATRSVMAGLDLQGTLGRIVGEAAQIAGTPHAKVLLVDRDAQALRLGAGAGRPDALLKGFQLPMGIGLSGIVAASGQPLYVPECQHDPRNVYTDQDRELGLVTYLGLPIMIRDEVVGVLTFNTTHPRQYSPDELACLASFAAQAAIAIQNARLYQEIQQHATTLDARVRERTAELEEALRIKAEFLGKMSHELRTPLNFVLGFTDLLQQETAGPITPKQSHYLERIRDGGKRLLDLVSTILDLSMAEMGKLAIQLEAIPLGPLVQDAMDLFALQAEQKGLQMTAHLDPALPVVVADRHKLAQILANLVGNAVKFTPDGGAIRLLARRADSSSSQLVNSSRPIDQLTHRPVDCPGDWVELAVEDSGIGIKPEDLERIFRGFEQVDSSDRRKYGGAGIGLTLVRTLVELHGGWAWAESEGPGRGARFIVRLPLLEAPQPKRILVVEDEAPVLEALAEVLRRAGFAVDQAETGAQALATLEARPPDLLVLDIGLPDVDGWAILKQVREREQTRTVPVLVLTGLEDVRANQVLAFGADEFLAKPVSPRVLVEIVARLLGRPARETPVEDRT